MKIIKTHPGQDGEKLLAEGEAIKAELRNLRAKFSAIFGSPDTELKGLLEVERMLEQAAKLPGPPDQHHSCPGGVLHRSRAPCRTGQRSPSCGIVAPA